MNKLQLNKFQISNFIVAVSFIDKLGRRPLLLFGVSGMAASLISLGVF